MSLENTPGPVPDRSRDPGTGRSGPVPAPVGLKPVLDQVLMPPQTAPDTFPDWHPCFRTLDSVPGPSHFRRAPTAVFLGPVTWAQSGPCGYSWTSCHLSDFSVNPCGSRGSLNLFWKRVQYVEPNRARLGPAWTGSPSPGPCRRPVQGNFGRASFRATPGEATAPGPTRSDLGASRPKR